MKGILFDPPDIASVYRYKNIKKKQWYKAGSGGIPDKLHLKAGHGETRRLRPAVFRVA
jgi:hypothetical protein